MSESEQKSAGRRIKIAFWVGDADTGERLCETQQCVMEFKTDEIEKTIQEARDKFTNLPSDQVDQLVAPLPWGWSREIINAGFLTVANYTKELVLKHLGYQTATEVLAAKKVAQ